jgi:hypothetical protein
MFFLVNFPKVKKELRINLSGSARRNPANKKGLYKALKIVEICKRVF